MRKRLETAREDKSADQRRYLKELDALRKNARYIHTLSYDHLRAWRDALAPGESQAWAERLDGLQTGLDGRDRGAQRGGGGRHFARAV